MFIKVNSYNAQRAQQLHLHLDTLHYITLHYAYISITITLSHYYLTLHAHNLANNVNKHEIASKKKDIIMRMYIQTHTCV
jgi:hypothetical protein